MAGAICGQMAGAFYGGTTQMARRMVLSSDIRWAMATVCYGKSQLFLGKSSCLSSINAPFSIEHVK